MTSETWTHLDNQAVYLYTQHIDELPGPRPLDRPLKEMPHALTEQTVWFAYGVPGYRAGLVWQQEFSTAVIVAQRTVTFPNGMAFMPWRPIGLQPSKTDVAVASVTDEATARQAFASAALYNDFGWFERVLRLMVDGLVLQENPSR